MKKLPKLRRDFTIEELTKYDGKGPDGRILVAVNGSVYDVTRGSKFYGPGELHYVDDQFSRRRRSLAAIVRRSGRYFCDTALFPSLFSSLSLSFLLSLWVRFY